MINLRRRWYIDWDNDTEAPEHYGIEYAMGVTQTMGDQTWYFDCINIPDPLPDGYSILEGDLRSHIGYGLSEDDVRFLEANYEQGQLQRVDAGSD